MRHFLTIYKKLPDKLVLFCLFFFIYLCTAFYPKPPGMSQTSGDEPHYLMMTYSMLHDGDLQVKNNHDEYAYHTWYPVPYLTPHLFAFNGANYPLHQPGLSVLILPAFTVGGRVGVVIFLSFLTSIAMTNIFSILLRFVSKKIALFTTLVVGLTTPIFVYFSLIYPEVMMFFLMSCVLRLILDKKFKLNFKMGALLTILLALMPPLHIKFGLLIGITLLYIDLTQYKKIKLPQLILFNIVVGICSSLYLLWMYNFFGGDLFGPMKYMSAGNSFKLEYVFTGLMGSLIDREGGILIYSPLYIFVFIGFTFLFRNWNKLKKEERSQRILIAGMIVIQTLFATMYPHILGGQNPPGRYFLPVFPAIAVVLAFAFEELLKIKIQKIIILLLSLYSLLISFIIATHPIFSLPFGVGNNMISFLLKDNAQYVLNVLPNFSKFDREISFEDYQKGITIMSILLLISMIHIFKLKKRKR
jgi:hypothetical protein